eukprot:c2107_g1_i1.p1 GENE.c2107_g1_i1~~c2107_g1_i1.p1  ORF type:complete len:373 (+),score=46.06 c2107_g1_i1:25-1143(+)
MERVKQLARTYAPILVLGEDQNSGYWPMSVDEFISHCDVIVSPNNPTQYFLQTKETITYGSQVLPWFHGCPPTSLLSEDLQLKILGEVSTKKVFCFDPGCQAPIYCFIFAGKFDGIRLKYTGVSNGIEEGTFVALFYAFFAYNRGKKIGVLNNTVVGNHIGDWEFVAISFENFVPVQLHFKPHSLGTCVIPFPPSDQHIHQPAKVLFSDNDVRAGRCTNCVPIDNPKIRFYQGRPVVYCGKGTHAMWPSSGKHKYAPPSTASIVAKDLWDNCGTECASCTVWFVENNIVFIPPEVWTGDAMPENSQFPFNWAVDIDQWGNYGVQSTLVVNFASMFVNEKVGRDMQEMVDGPRGFLRRSPFKEFQKPVKTDTK